MLALHDFVYLTLLCTSKLAMSVGEPLHIPSDNFKDLIRKEKQWEAGRNFPPYTPLEHIRQRGSARIDISEFKKLPVMKHDPKLIESLPETFDPRDKWPMCPTLNEIRDQGQCGACWAFGAVESMTDRVCTYSNGSKNFYFSAEDVITCNSDSSGCDGGNPMAAWTEWVDVGLVSGGNYNSHQGCKPYSFATCANHMKKCTKWKPTPPCVHSCEKGYYRSYVKDKKRGKSFYPVAGEKHIMAELYKNGPAEAFFIVYEDFADYKGGVYQHIKGEFVFGHAVKLMGWGVEKGEKYWLAANSWGTGFGENGFFKLLRGVDECYIEQFVLAGEPLLDDY